MPNPMTPCTAIVGEVCATCGLREKPHHDYDAWSPLHPFEPVICGMPESSHCQTKHRREGCLRIRDHAFTTAE